MHGPQQWDARLLFIYFFYIRTYHVVLLNWVHARLFHVWWSCGVCKCPLTRLPWQYVMASRITLWHTKYAEAYYINYKSFRKVIPLGSYCIDCSVLRNNAVNDLHPFILRTAHTHSHISNPSGDNLAYHSTCGLKNIFGWHVQLMFLHICWYRTLYTHIPQVCSLCAGPLLATRTYFLQNSWQANHISNNQDIRYVLWASSQYNAAFG